MLMYECFDRRESDLSNDFFELGDFDIEYIRAELVLLRACVSLLLLR